MEILDGDDFKPLKYGMPRFRKVAPPKKTSPEASKTKANSRVLTQKQKYIEYVQKRLNLQRKWGEKPISKSQVKHLLRGMTEKDLEEFIDAARESKMSFPQYFWTTVNEIDKQAREM